MKPINFSDAAHERGWYVDPLSPDEKLIGITTAISMSIGRPYLEQAKLNLAAQCAYDDADEIAVMAPDDAIAHVKKASERAWGRAAIRGTVVHRALELYATDGEPDDMLDAEILPYVQAGMDFLRDHVAEVIWTEATLFGPGYAGTGDGLVRLHDGRIAGFDYKTGSRVHPEVGLQLAALRFGTHSYGTDGSVDDDNCEYQKLSNLEQKWDLGLVVHLKPNGKYVVRKVACGHYEYRAFAAAVSFARFRKWGGFDKLVGERLTSDYEVSATNVALNPDLNESAAVAPYNLTASVEAPADTDPAAEPPDAVALIQQVFPGAELEEDPPPAAFHAWLRERINAVKVMPEGKDGLALIASQWPEGVAKPKQCDGYSQTETDLLHDVIARAEKLVGAPFPEPRPGTLVPGTYEPQPVAEETLDADSPRIKKLVKEYELLPDHLVTVLVNAHSELIAKVWLGKATKAEVAKAARAIHAATKKAKDAAKAA